MEGGGGGCALRAEAGVARVTGTHQLCCIQWRGMRCRPWGCGTHVELARVVHTDCEEHWGKVLKVTFGFGGALMGKLHNTFTVDGGTRVRVSAHLPPECQ